MSDTQGNEVQKAIVAITRDIGSEGVAKGQRNKEQGYAYRGIDDMLNALSPLYAKHNIFIRPNVLEREVTEAKTKSGTALWKVTIKVEYHIVSSLDGSREVCTTYGEAMDSADKASNKALSAAYKYLVIQLFAIPVEGHDDADANTPEPVVRDHEPVATLDPTQQAEIAKLAKAAGVKGADILAWVSKRAGYEIANIAAIPLDAYEPLKKSFVKKAKPTTEQTEGATA
jgi:hypothetical protein